METVTARIRIRMKNEDLGRYGGGSDDCWHVGYLIDS